MIALLRLAVASLLALALALPILGGEGGGPNGGGTGVWVLPLSSFLGGDLVGPPRDVHVGISTAQSLVLQTSGEGDGLAATFCDELSGEPLELPVVGDCVTVPVAVLQALAQRIGARADVVINDSSRRGYLLRLEVAADRTVTVRVY